MGIACSTYLDNYIWSELHGSSEKVMISSWLKAEEVTSRNSGETFFLLFFIIAFLLISPRLVDNLSYWQGKKAE